MPRYLPFGDDEFGAIVSIDAFAYFGTDVHLLPNLLRVLGPGGTSGMTTPALRIHPYDQPPSALVTALVGGCCLAHTPGWWQRHWGLTGLLTDVHAVLQPGSRDDWILWARAAGETDNGPLLTMLTSMACDEIGFALVSATKGD